MGDWRLCDKKPITYAGRMRKRDRWGSRNVEAALVKVDRAKGQNAHRNGVSPQFALEEATRRSVLTDSAPCSGFEGYEGNGRKRDRPIVEDYDSDFFRDSKKPSLSHNPNLNQSVSGGSSNRPFRPKFGSDCRSQRQPSPCQTPHQRNSHSFFRGSPVNRFHGNRNDWEYRNYRPAAQQKLSWTQPAQSRRDGGGGFFTNRGGKRPLLRFRAEGRQSRSPNNGTGRENKENRDHESRKSWLENSPKRVVYERKDEGAEKAVEETGDLPSGFPNDETQCYRNASLQALFGLEPFVQDLCRARKMNQAESFVGADSEESMAVDERVLIELVNVFVARKSGEKDKLDASLRRLNACISKKSRGLFCVDRMNDANEYLQLLLNSLSDLADKKRKKPASSSAEQASTSTEITPPAPPNSPEPTSLDINPILSNFGFKITETLTCDECGKETIKEFDENKELFLDMPEMEDDGEGKRGNLRDYLKAYFASEKRDRTCEEANCSGKTATVLPRLSQLPRMFHLNLKRYHYKDNVAKKTVAKVTIPKFLNVSDIISDKETIEPPIWERIPLSPIKTFNRKQNNFAGGQVMALPARPNSPTHFSTPPPPLVDLDSDPDSGFSSLDEDSDLQRAMAESLRDYEKSLTQAKQRSLEDSDSLGSSSRPGSAMDVNVDGGKEWRTNGSGGGEEAEFETPVRGEKNGRDDEDEGLVEDDDDDRPGEDRGLRYRLVSIISHRGEVSISGHYTADVYKVSEDTWYHCDDMTVSKVKEEEVMGGRNLSQGYIFFYMNENVLEVARQGRSALAGAMDLAEPLSP